MRAIRILHDYDIADKSLVVKASEKAKEELTEYVKKKNPTATEPNELIDDNTKREDNEIKSSISMVLREHELELSRDLDSNKGKIFVSKKSLNYHFV